MNKTIVTGLLILTILAPNLNATETEVANLTEEQQELKDEISKSTIKIDEYQQELNTANAEIASNESEIQSLNSEIDSLKSQVEDMVAASSDTLVVMQKLNNQNTFAKYLIEDNGENFFLKYQNLQQLTSTLTINVNDLIANIKTMQSNLNTVEEINQENVNLKTESETILEKQLKKEDELRETLSDVDSSLLDANQQLTLEQAKELETSENKDKLDETETKDNSTKQVKEPEVVEPEVPEVVEPEVPEVVEPEVPEVVEPDSQYPADGNVSGYKNQIMSAAGISSSDYQYVDYIVNRESSWNYLNSNAVSGAYGLCQALPGSKMSSSGSDWATNPETQMSWCNSYALSRYGSWSQAYDFWLENNWW
ncbi:hypothetical protein R2F61_08095 [Mollicutes bacterium LVI A0078]|nr:hypothetical protein RZE84_07870 [Mollicutes bacterium LVI A0075]WOO90674.1 hypothetical protein R2F61_08095 [Mollicutes bacterium LVI A0078]